MQPASPDFKPVFQALSESGIRYVLIGGLAMIVHGSAYITQDIDICYARDNENLTRIEALFKAHHVRLRGVPDDLPFLFDVRTLKNVLNLTLATDLGDVDILGDPPGVESFEKLWERSSEIEIYGIPVRVASIEDLIAMKRAANRPKDQGHLIELLELQKLIHKNEFEPS